MADLAQISAAKARLEDKFEAAQDEAARALGGLTWDAVSNFDGVRIRWRLKCEMTLAA
jgi:hypothetical protein